MRKGKERGKKMLPSIKIRFERWKFNKDYGVYVSTHGRFRNRDKADLPYLTTNNGYLKIKVECTTCEFEFAHRLVMITWHPTTEMHHLTIDHKNHNKRDNSLENLEWVTAEENRRRADMDYLPAITKKIEHETWLNGAFLIDDIVVTRKAFIEQIKLERPQLTEEAILSTIKGAAKVRHAGSPSSKLFGHKYSEIRGIKA